MSNKQKSLLAFVFIVAVFSINFYQVEYATLDSVKYARISLLTVSIFLSLPFFFVKNGGLTPYIQAICTCAVISVFMARFSWGQDYTDTLKATIPLLSWFFYFFLLKYEISIESLEKVSVFYGILFIIFYIFQYTHSGTVYFGYEKAFKGDRGVVRVLFSGEGFFNLIVFTALNKFTDSAKNKQLWLLLLIAGLVITIMQVTRQAIAAVFIVCFYHFIRDQSITRKAVTLGLFVGSLIFILYSDNVFVGKLFNQSDQNNTISRNIRLNEADYFLSNYSPGSVNMILGNGVPYGETRYGLFNEFLQSKGDYYTDIGLVSFYTFFGIFALIAILILYFKSLTFKIPKKYIYLKYYVFFLIVTSLTSDSCFNFGYLITNVFVFYSLQFLFLEQKNSLRTRLT